MLPFRDHYIERRLINPAMVFLTTANDLSTVRVRCSTVWVIELPSYTAEEKR